MSQNMNDVLYQVKQKLHSKMYLGSEVCRYLSRGVTVPQWKEAGGFCNFCRPLQLRDLGHMRVVKQFTHWNEHFDTALFDQVA